MVVLGIDPGIALMGYGFVRENDHGDPELLAYGAISTSSDMSVERRLLQIYNELTKLIEKYEPVTAGVEKLLFGKNVTNAMMVGQARGVAILTLVQHGIKIAEYTPAEIKQAVAGYGNAPKPQMQEMVRLLLELEDIPRPDDAADALAVAITHMHSARYQNLVDS